MKHAIIALAVTLLLASAAWAEEKPCPAGDGYVRCLADRGDPRAQFEIGMAAFELAKDSEAQNGTSDYEEALLWLKRAAKAGHPRAQATLGFMYWEGWGVPVNNVKAYRWFMRAGKGGFPAAEQWMEKIEDEIMLELDQE